MSIEKAYLDVLDFHKKFSCYIGDKPSVPAVGTVDLRIKLIKEEFDEMVSAMISSDLPGVADGAVDLIYVVLGTLISYGIDPIPVWDAVQVANMSKVGGGKRADGKVTKPAGWVAPDVAGILREQGWEGPEIVAG